MPLYDYRCTECGTEIEVRHGIEASGPAACKVCGGGMRKLVSTPAIHFKGSGWAKKDAQSAAAKSSPNATEDAATDKDGSSTEGSTDKKDTASSEGKSEPASSESTTEASADVPSKAASSDKTTKASSADKAGDKSSSD